MIVSPQISGRNFYEKCSEQEIYLVDKSRFFTKRNEDNSQLLVRQEGVSITAIYVSSAPPIHDNEQKMKETWTPLNVKTDIRTCQHFVGIRCDIILIFQ